MAADPVCQTYFGLDADDFGHLTHELVRGLSRLGLEKDMARAVREVSGYRNLRRDRLVWRQASMAAYCVNAFVDCSASTRPQPAKRGGPSSLPGARAPSLPKAGPGRLSRPAARAPAL